MTYFLQYDIIYAVKCIQMGDKIMTYNEASALLAEHGQQQLLAYFEELTEKQREYLLGQIAKINFTPYHALDLGVVKVK